MQQKYDEFIKKFEQSRTTDDCFTPPEVYNAIKDWVCKRYNINPDSISRPFYPGGRTKMKIIRAKSSLIIHRFRSCQKYTNFIISTM